MRSAKRDARLTLQHREHQYVALKIYIHNSAQHRELPFYEKLNKALPSRHIGAENIRKLLGSFKVNGPFGTHIVLVLQASQMSLRDMDTVFMQGRGFNENFVKSAIKELLQALDFLHSKVQVVHTGTQPFHHRLNTFCHSGVSASIFPMLNMK